MGYLKLQDALSYTRKQLGDFLEAETLLTASLGLRREDLYLHPEDSLNRVELKRLRGAIEQRKKHLPLAYITGEQEFYSLGFKVTPDTFIPRPETEFLVDTVLNKIPESPTLRVEKDGDPVVVVDLGTGCGNIIITLAKYILQARLYATDISRKALAVAGDNARRHSVAERIVFASGDLISPLKNHGLAGKIDFLISNPPYIRSSDLRLLMPEVAHYEPRLALDGGEDGLSCYRIILREASRYLKPKGHLILELGINQASPVKEIIEKTSAFEAIEIIKDYSGIERVISATRREGVLRE
jgi:release factor glutamine methyltransferase